MIYFLITKTQAHKIKCRVERNLKFVGAGAYELVKLFYTLVFVFLQSNENYEIDNED